LLRAFAMSAARVEELQGQPDIDRAELRREQRNCLQHWRALDLE
jgi:hypothetical protein